MADAVQRLGRLDILVNNAALFFRTPVLTTTPAQFDRLLAVNLRAPFFVSQAAARAMGRRGGRIINIADVGAVRAWAGYVPYGISKAGVVMLTRGLAVALAPRIQVNAVAPGRGAAARGLPARSGDAGSPRASRWAGTAGPPTWRRRSASSPPAPTTSPARCSSWTGACPPL